MVQNNTPEKKRGNTLITAINWAFLQVRWGSEEQLIKPTTTPQHQEGEDERGRIRGEGKTKVWMAST